MSIVNCTEDAEKGNHCIITQLVLHVASSHNETKTFKKSPLINDQIKKAVEIYISVFGFSITSLFGLGTNIVNIVVYKKHGLKDSITVGFFALSLSDLIVVLCPLVTAACYAAKHLDPTHPVNFPGVHYVSSAWVRNMIYSLSLVITCLLAIERCCCVILPFKVKQIFTRKRTTLIISALIVFHVICFLPIFLTHRLQWVQRGPGNGTWKLSVRFSQHRQPIEQFNSTLMGIVLPTIAQFIVTVSAVIMIKGVRKSSRFRQQVSHSQSTKQPTQLPSDLGKSCEDLDSRTFSTVAMNTAVTTKLSTSQKSNNVDTMSKRDTRLTKTMIFLVACLSASNIPFLAIVYARRLVPDLNIGKAYQNTFSVCYSVVYVLGTLNASANMFIYYFTSSRFKQICKETFGRSKRL